MRLVAVVAVALLRSGTVSARTRCESQQAEGHTSKLCLLEPGMFQHYTISLEVDGDPIFSLVEDYAEDVALTHKVPEGLGIEMPLSLQGGRTVKISGGCVPQVHAEGVETERACNFSWGQVKIIQDVRFKL